MKRYIVSVSVLVAVAGFASVALANHSWGGYHWARTANPFTVKLGSNVTAVWSAALAGASADWSVSDVLDAPVVQGQANPKNCRPTAGRVEVCNSKYGNNGWLGIAQIWASGTHITQGTVKLNDTYFNTAQYNTPAWRSMVACQEIGHTFGLDHQDEAFDNLNLGTCMDYTNDPSRNDGAGNNLHPNAHDYEELDLIYAHLDATTTIRSSVSGNSKADFDASDDLGKELHRSANGRSSLFERDLGNGRKIFSFVIWAN